MARLIDLEIRPALWTRPTLGEKDRQPSLITMANGGWTFHGKEELRVQIEGQDWLEMGAEYLGLITFGDAGYTFDAPTGRPEWIVLQLLPISGGRVTRGLDGPFAKSLKGKTPAEVAGLLSSTRADDNATAYMGLDPVLRFQRVMAKTNEPGEPASGESP